MDVVSKELADRKILSLFESKYGDSYFPRVYDVEKIFNKRSTFAKGLADHFQSEGMARSEAQLEAEDFIDSILGIGDGEVGVSDLTRLALDKGVSFTKTRTDLPFDIMKDFLILDATQVVPAYLQEGFQMIRFHEKLAEMGAIGKSTKTVDKKSGNTIERLSPQSQMQDLVNMIKADYDAQLIKNMQLPDAERDIAQAQAAQQLKTSIDLANDIMRMSLGQYATKSKADPAFRMLKTYNYTRLLGNVLISSIGDPAMTIMHHGLGGVIMDGYVAQMRTFSAGLRAAKIADLHDMGIALDAEMDNTIKMLMDGQTDTTHIQSSMERKTNVAGEIFSKISGIHDWNVLNRRASARMTESHILRALKNPTKSVEDIEYLKHLGIGPEDANLIIKFQDKYGKDLEGDTHLSNVRQWRSSPEGNRAADIFSAAVVKEVAATIIMPGKGDIPFLAQKNQLMSSLFQFKGFFAGSTTKLTLSALDRRDAKTLQSILAMVALGGLQYVIRQKIADKPINLSSTNLLIEGINRSGLLGLLGDPMFALILNPILGQGGSRYQNQNPVEYIFGPSGSILKSLMGIGTDVFGRNPHDKIDKGTLKSLESLVPAMNLFYLRRLVDKMNNEVMK